MDGGANAPDIGGGCHGGGVQPLSVDGELGTELMVLKDGGLMAPIRELPLVGASSCLSGRGLKVGEDSHGKPSPGKP